MPESALDESYFYSLYQTLLSNKRPARDRHRAYDFIQQQLIHAQALPCTLPAEPEDLGAWLTRRLSLIEQRHTEYHLRRKQGGAREFFASKGHALLYFQRVAPRKVVEGAWLYGTLQHWDDVRLQPLIRRYIADTGAGSLADNRVYAYQQLLAKEGVNTEHTLADSDYHQASIQLALGLSGSRLLPEVVGFNLGHESWMLQLHNIRDELFELVDGQDFNPYRSYRSTGAADVSPIKVAMQVLIAMLPPDEEHRKAFYQRVKDGFRLSLVGSMAQNIVFELHQSGSLQQAVLDIMVNRFAHGRLGHDDHHAQDSTDHSGHAEVIRFLDSLQAKGWIRLGVDPSQSRLWEMINMDQGIMSGVFSPAEKQIIYDWIASSGQGDDSGLKLAANMPSKSRWPLPQRSAMRKTSKPQHHDVPSEVRQQLDRADTVQRFDLLTSYLRTAVHPTPIGQWAARQYLIQLNAHTPLATHG
jgi:hypothetical protein